MYHILSIAPNGYEFQYSTARKSEVVDILYELSKCTYGYKYIVLDLVDAEIDFIISGEFSDFQIGVFYDAKAA